MLRKKHINPPLDIYKKIALSFIILTLILIVVIFYFTLSYSYITIFPKNKEIATDYNFIIVEDAAAANPSDGIFTGKIVNQTLEGEKEFAASGTKMLAGDVAGKVKIYNNLSRSQILIATTRLLSPEGIIFRLKSRVEIPSKGTVEAEVYPDDPTKLLALAGTKFTVPGLSPSLQSIVYAEAVEDFKATGQEVKVISQEDMDNALTLYSDELSQQLVKDEDASKMKILSKEVITQEYSHKVGDQIDNFKIKLGIKVIGVIFDDQPVRAFAKKTLEDLVPADQQLISESSDKLVYEIEKTDLVNKIAQVKGNIKGLIVISETSQILDRDKLMGLNLDELKAYLENFEDIEQVEINFFPSWVKKMPFFQDHIIIKVNK